MSFDYIRGKTSFHKYIKSENAPLESDKEYHDNTHSFIKLKNATCIGEVSSMVVVMGRHVKFPHVVNKQGYITL